MILRKMLRTFPRFCLSLYFVGRKHPVKSPPNFLQNFPPQKSKNITDELLQERRETKMFSPNSIMRKSLFYLRVCRIHSDYGSTSKTCQRIVFAIVHGLRALEISEHFLRVLFSFFSPLPAVPFLPESPPLLGPQNSSVS